MDLFCNSHLKNVYTMNSIRRLYRLERVISTPGLSQKAAKYGSPGETM